MNHEDQQKRKNKYVIESVMRWILFGILIVVAPPIVYVGYNKIIGFDVNYIEFIPDMLLGTLAVCCNFLNTCFDTEKKVAYLLRWLFGIIFGTIGIVCWGLSLILCYLPVEELIERGYLLKNAQMMYNISVIIMAVCGIIGIIIEIYTNYNRGGK